MFHTRYTLHKTVYSHKVGKALEYMHVDALLAANEYLGIADAIHDPDLYLNLTDSIIKEIERSKVPELEESRAIIKRMRRRDLYRFVDQLVIDPLYRPFFPKKSVKPLDIVKHQRFGDDLKENDILIDDLVLTYAMKDRNPVDHVNFYNKWNPDELHKISREEVSKAVRTQLNLF